KRVTGKTMAGYFRRVRPEFEYRSQLPAPRPGGFSGKSPLCGDAVALRLPLYRARRYDFTGKMEGRWIRLLSSPFKMPPVISKYIILATGSPRALSIRFRNCLRFA